MGIGLSLLLNGLLFPGSMLALVLMVTGGLLLLYFVLHILLYLMPREANGGFNRQLLLVFKVFDPLSEMILVAGVLAFLLWLLTG